MSTKTPLRLQVALFAFTRLVLNTNMRMLYPFLAVFARGLGVPLESVTLAVTVRQTMGAATPFLGPLADRFGRRIGMIIGLVVTILGLGVVVVWPTFPAFFAALSLTFVGSLLCISAMQAYLGDAVVYEQRGQMMALVELGWSLSFILGVPVVGILIQRYGWQSPFPMLATLALVCLALTAWLVPGDAPPVGQIHASMWSKLGLVLASPSALAALGMGMAITAANKSVNLMFGVWMEDSFGLKVAALGAATAIIGISEFSGKSMTAWLVDRLGKERSVRYGLVLNCLAALALPVVGRSTVGALVGLFFFYISFEIVIVSMLPLLSEILPEARATLLGVNLATFSLGRALGTLAAPRLYPISFFANVALALALDLLALFLLSRIRLGGQIKQDNQDG